MEEVKVKRHRCVHCNKLFREEEMIYGPDPFASEIHGIDTKVWECEQCHYESMMEI